MRTFGQASALRLSAELESGQWPIVSGDAFLLVKRLYDLPDQWSFQIGSPDLDPEEMKSEAGEAAFMLRRLQALRYLTGDLRCAPLSVVFGHADELNRYLPTLISRDRVVESGEADFLVLTLERLEGNLRSILSAAWLAQSASR